MSAHPVWFVGNLLPSITETITDTNGAPVDLSSSTVKLKMRPLGSSTAKVNATATVVNGPLGQVRYDWQAADVDTAGEYLVWWEVTTGAKKQDLNEASVVFAAHAPAQRAYVELEEFKSTAELTGTNFANEDIRQALVAASRGIDSMTGRRFYLDADANQVRYFSGADVVRGDASRRWWDGFEWLANPGWELRVDDLVAITSLKTDADGDGTYEQTWAQGTDFTLESRNAPADGSPYTTIRIPPGGNFRFPVYADSIEITGQFGWADVPAAIKQATTILAARLLQRARQSPTGIAGVGLDGAAVRVGSIERDPDIGFLLAPYMRKKLFA